MDKEKILKKLEEECQEFCQQHSLANEGSRMVFGEGSVKAKIMMIGEAPGYHESVTGRPFCGAAGKVLDDLLQEVKLKREEIYITNLLKLRPPDNRDPRPEEIKAFAPFLDQQIAVIQPKILCSLGNFATRYLLEKYHLGDKLIQEGKRVGISQLHGQVFSVQNLFQVVKIVPLYHPAVVTYNPFMKETLLKDFKKLKEIESKI